MNGGVGAFTTFGSDTPKKPLEKLITVEGSDVKLDAITLHDAGVLPGGVTGVAYNPDAGDKPYANAFGMGIRASISLGFFIPLFLLRFSTTS